MNSYSEEDLLALSGIQHFAFCERQWGLIHIETQWVENVRTIEGKHLHQKVDDPYFIESRVDVKTVRSVPLVSKKLGLYGVADVIELKKLSEDNSNIRYCIVEYKRGKPKPDDRDEVQLCAQAICLEEMLDTKLDGGYLYYGETKHRHRVEFNDTLRTRVKELAEKMHMLYTQGKTPPALKGKRCKNCSMINICMPKVGNGSKSTEKYLAKVLDEMRNE